MTKVMNIAHDNGIYKLQGCFDKFSIPMQWKQFKVLLKDNAPKNFDLSEVTECDSALIALLVEVKRQYPAITITNVPENLLLLLDLYQVKHLLS